MKCYIEDCILDALLTDDCFAYCSREHKAQVVMTDYDETAKPRTPKEMEYRIGLMKKRYLEKKLQEKGRLF